MSGRFQRAKVSWISDSGGGFIHMDAIPMMTHDQQSKITDFALEEGAVASDHIIHLPDVLKLEVVQTNQPFEDSDDGEPIVFERSTMPLELPKTRYEATGLLLLTIGAGAAIGAAVDAIGGAFGLDTSEPPIQVSVFKPPYENKDRINDLFDKLTEARLNAYEMSIEWLGRSWTSYYIQSIGYTRKKGAEKGEFSVTLKHVQTASAGVAELPSPAEARLEVSADLGNRPGSLSDAEDIKAAGGTAPDEGSLAFQALF